MCDETYTVMLDQAVEWVFESTWRMMFDNADLFASYHFENLLADVIHLENMKRGVIGYKPDLNFDFAIGL